MSQFTIDIGKVATGGPYAYTIYRNGLGAKSVTGVLDARLAFDAVRDDLIALLVNETVIRISINIQSN